MDRIPLSAGPHAGAALPGCDGERADADTKDADMNALRNENAYLRELVVQLSKLVLKNVLDRK